MSGRRVWRRGLSVTLGVLLLMLGVAGSASGEVTDELIQVNVSTVHLRVGDTAFLRVAARAFPPSPCRVRLVFATLDGRELAAATETLAERGDSALLRLVGADVVVGDSSIAIVAHVRFPPNPCLAADVVAEVGVAPGPPD